MYATSVVPCRATPGDKRGPRHRCFRREEEREREKEKEGERKHTVPK